MKEMVHKNKILEMVTGSQLYGTSTPESDTDTMGIFIPDIKYFIGLETVEEVDLSITSKLENGKNDKDAEDIKFYTLNKFVKLAMENNPNILSELFVSPECILFQNDLGKKLIDNKHLFPWKGLAQKYIGYSKSQSHKMVIKVSNYDSFQLAHDWLQEKMYIKGDETKYESSKLLAEFRTSGVPGIKFYDAHATIGDINVGLSDKISKVYNKVVDRMSKVGNREELYTKYGYDVKFGTNLVRLLIEGKELLTTGSLQYPLKEKDMLMDIRNGKWTQDEILKFADEGVKELDILKVTSTLPDKPNYQEIQNLLISMNKEFLMNQF